jgi:hypothetical protein
MSTEFELRLRSTFTVHELRQTTEAVLALIRPGLPLTELHVVPSTRDFLEHGHAAERATEDFLHHSYGLSNDLGPAFVLMTSDAVAAVEVSAQDVGFAEDPDGGRWLTITTSLDRTPVSKLLGAAAAIAAGRLTGSPIVDEEAILTGERIADPEEAIQRIRTSAAGAAHLSDVDLSRFRTST